MRRLRIRSPLVIHETVDEEVVIVNLETGNYYSLVGTGARIWAALERTATVDEIVSDLRAAYGSSETALPRLDELIDDFLGDLEREGLVVPFDGLSSSSGDDATGGPAGSARHPGRPGPAAEGGPPGVPPVFAPPALEKFTDMQELILLDPVHEVDEEKGWPYVEGREAGDGP